MEINSDLCNLQQEIIEKYNMTDRVEVNSFKLRKLTKVQLAIYNSA